MYMYDRPSWTGEVYETECYFPTYDPMGSTGGGWRENAAYYDMRNAFGMFYQPGGTGTGNNG